MKNGYIKNNDYETYYEIYGELKENTVPLIILHGGPGGNIFSYRPLHDLVKFGYTVILYNQHGSPKSKIINKTDKTYTLETYEEELEALIKGLHIKKYYLLGHSWGGMLAMHYVINKKPHDLVKLILFSTLPSTQQWNEESLRLISHFSKKQKEALVNFYNNKEYNKVNYKRGVKRFIFEHLNDKRENAYKYATKNPYKLNLDAYNYMWGDSELFGKGTLKDFNMIPRLNEIKVPTLIINGQEDESTPYINKNLHEGIKDSIWVLLKDSQHVGYAQEQELTLKSIDSFLKN